MKKSRFLNNIFIAIKITAAAVIAIILADILSLQFGVSAGIVAILSVAGTKKETLKTAGNRFLAFAVALVAAIICYEVIGFRVEAFMVYLLIFITVCQCMGWNNAMAMDSVLISHFLTLGNMSSESIFNEVMLFIIGVGMGIIVNLHLHKNTAYIEKMKDETDEQMKIVLERMSKRIMNPDYPEYDGLCFRKLHECINKAQETAQQNYMNQLVAEDRFDIDYIAMREEQVNILQEMYKRVKTLHTTPLTAESISGFLGHVAEKYHRDNTAKELLEEFYRLRNSMKNKPLPTEREEFEERAELFVLLQDMEEFLLIKRNFVRGE